MAGHRGRALRFLELHRKGAPLLLANAWDAGSARLLAAGHEFPSGHLVNGPWADALHHVGQITLLRKALGNPAPSAQPFLGQPPSDV